jgi:hypothetical protein
MGMVERDRAPGFARGTRARSDREGTRDPCAYPDQRAQVGARASGARVSSQVALLGIYSVGANCSARKRVPTEGGRVGPRRSRAPRS